MAAIRLQSGSLVDSDVILDAGDGIELKYHPRMFVRSVEAKLTDLLESIQSVYETAERSERDRLTRPQEEKVTRLMCDVISLLVGTDEERHPQAGDLLFDGWRSDKVAWRQIDGLFGALTRPGEGESPS